MRFILAILILYFSLNLAGQVSFEAVTDAQSVVQNSSFQLSFMLKNAQGSQFNAPDFNPFQVISGPARSMQTQILNGVMTSSIGYVYTLACSQIGTFTIKPATILVNGKILYSKPITIKVVKANTVSNKGSEIIVRALLDKQEIFIGEQVSLTYKLFTQVNIENMEAGSRPNLDAFQDQPINILNNPTLREIYNGKEYTTKILSKTALFAVKSGKINIAPIIYRVFKGANDPFGFNMPSLFNSEIENVASNELNILVKELPQPIPQNFSGAVGLMAIQFNPISLTYSLNDAIHLGIQLQGDANFNTLNPDFIKLDSSFEITDSKSGDIIKVTDEPRLTNTRKFDFIFLPKKTGQFIITPSFVYFNTSEKIFITLTDSFSLDINPGNLPIKAIDPYTELAPIIQKPTFTTKEYTLFSNPKTLLLSFLPIILIGLGFILKYKNKKPNKKGNPAQFTLSITNELKIENLEQLLLQKIKSNFKETKHLQTLTAAKVYFNQTLSGLARVGFYLNAIQQLETVKYSGNIQFEKLQELSELIKQLEELST